jgi:hypothetical protein
VSSRIAAEQAVVRWLIVATLVAWCSAASAEPTVPAPPQDAALAQSLFDEARQLMIANRFDEACPKLAESHRLDPALGTLLNLAVCNEQLGKTASAWAEYRDAESVAKREGRSERASYAHGHAAALEPRLSHLVIRRASVGSGDIEVRLDGDLVGEAAFGSAVAVDPGVHRIEARANGKKAWIVSVTIGDHADKKTAEIPPLEDAPPPPELRVAVAPVPGEPGGQSPALAFPTAPSAEVAPPVNVGARRTAAYVTGGVGLAALAFGAVAGMQAIVRWNDRTKLCAGDACSQAGLDADADARSWALGSDIGFGAGVLALGAATYLFLTSKGRNPPRVGGLSLVRIVPIASAHTAGLGLVLTSR